MHLAQALLVIPALVGSAPQQEAPRAPRLRTIELDIGESREVELSDGAKARVKLLGVEELRDRVCGAIREARVEVEVNGQTTTLVSANYRLPVTFAGVQIDCPATKGLYKNHDPWEDSWGLEKDARLRLWPERSPWFEPGTLVYPIKQRWFADATQMGNEPAFVDGGDAPTGRVVYYHSGLDIGGCEGMAEVVAACDGLVVSATGEKLADSPELPYYEQAAYDSVYVLGAHGWLFRYVHLKSIDPAVRAGRRVKMGQKLGLLGKEGGSGGYAHLHFDIKSVQPSGKWGIQDGYAFLWEAYLREHKPRILAVARPHRIAWAGDRVTLDGSRSWAAGKIERFEWTLTDGTTAGGPQIEHSYAEPGEYSEILKVVDADGNLDYDFAVVLVIDRKSEGKFSPTIHASFAPTFNIHPGDPVTFKVRSFHTEPVGETWDFGDGSAPEQVRSDGGATPHAPNGYAATVHRFAKPGHYLVRVEQIRKDGARATARLQVRVGDRLDGPNATHRTIPAGEATRLRGHR